MILTFKSIAYLQHLSLFAWFFLLNISLINNLAPQSDQWITICTQQGLRLINVNNTDQPTASNHTADPCECVTDTLVSQANKAKTLAVITATTYHLTYRYWAKAPTYRPLNPRAPPIS